ncbi:hypothetical protein JAAARDRAFT_188560 [Jaapia argillacea MUCL 33604]|uniref:Pyridoxamine 5'-phosphate oxidase Alr4036 family FMN-binding domain-containing protein n=1 Tax=Jaapia argillacea MUCL 33604 TaxID=933084 RepID=A0A067Q9W8_9AGAM|nr:hypothetical protein JAAARDRAFT_188560 [Jaapia argillacea MUCL 33604]
MPWLSAVHKAVAELGDEARAFALATVDTNGMPHVRTYMYRSTLASKPFPQIPILISSTDIRAAKVDQMVDNPSNPTGEVEMCFWIASTMEQIRIRGHAFVLPALSHPLSKKFHLERFPGLEGLVKVDGIDLESVRRNTFENMPPDLKVSWCGPTPGSVLPGGYRASTGGPETLPKFSEATEERQNWEDAFGKFALIGIEPFEVDYVEMKVTPNRRRRFLLEEDEWKETDVAL